MVNEDPHGMVELFASRLESNLKIMGPRPATEDALVTVKQHLDASDFIDLSHKGSERQYIKVEKRERTGKSAIRKGRR